MVLDVRHPHPFIHFSSSSAFPFFIHFLCSTLFLPFLPRISISSFCLLLSSFPWFSPVMAMTSVLFIFHVFSLHSAVDGALAAPPPYVIFLHETHTQPHMRTNTCARIEACAHKELCGSKLPFQLRLFMTCKDQRQAGAPITLPWKPFHFVCVCVRRKEWLILTGKRSTHFVILVFVI